LFAGSRAGSALKARGAGKAATRRGNLIESDTLSIAARFNKAKTGLRNARNRVRIDREASQENAGNKSEPA